MRTVIWVLLITAAFACPAMAKCDEDTIETVSDDGDVLIMLSGHVYQVDPGDEVDSQLWLTADDVLICGDTMINTDEDGEKVGITLLK